MSRLSPSTWTSANTLASSVVAYNAVVDSKGALKIGYINNIETSDEPAGIYYRQLGSGGWSVEKLIYPSRYFRSLTVTDDANIRLAATTENNIVNTYIAWDDRAQRRIFLSKSSDGGQTWGDAFQVRGPEDFAGVEQPYNIDLGAAGDQVLLTWQVGVPGKQ